MTDDLVFRSDMAVELIDHMGNDKRVVRAARVSTGSGELDIPGEEFAAVQGLINYLMKHRHGSPFEKGVFEFRVECPIFVAREFMRHRIASYNEESARYKVLKGVFWVPEASRPLVQEGKPGHYIMKPGEKWQYDYAVRTLTDVAEYAYARYETMIENGICREVARAALTVAVYTSFYVTINARSLMNFLSLRIDDPDNSFITKPQYEIEQVALGMQDEFSRCMPITYNAFEKHGRVAP